MAGSIFGDPSFGLQNAFYNENPQAAYRNWTTGLGVSSLGIDPRSRFYQQQYGNQYTNYLAALPQQDNVNYSFTDYLQQHGNALAQQFAGLSQSQRGENAGPYQARYRWVL